MFDRGPRQVGKTSLLARLGTHQIVYLDDAATRLRAQEDARFFTLSYYYTNALRADDALKV